MLTSLKKTSDIALFYLRLKFNKNLLPLCYFNDVPNVGDELNLTLISKISGRTPVKPTSLRFFKHLCAVGSVLSSMNSKSVVWGSGLISENAIDNIHQLGDIRAVRGYLTKKIIEQRFHIHLDVPLGDPALLMPMFVKPANVQKKYKFGLVLHYVDKYHPVRDLVPGLGGKIIDVAQDINEFVAEICQCEAIISSSMHGLILADAYKIPNQRIVLSNNIVGGDFKFQDYYSTTTQPENKPVVFSNNITTEDIMSCLSLVAVKESILNLEHLLGSYPHDM